MRKDYKGQLLPLRKRLTITQQKKRKNKIEKRKIKLQEAPPASEKVE